MAKSINFEGYSISFNDIIYKYMTNFIESNLVFADEYGEDGKTELVSYKIQGKDKGFLHMEELSLRTGLFRRIYVNTGEDDKNIIDISGYDKLSPQQRTHIQSLLKIRAEKTQLENRVINFLKQQHSK